VIDGGLDASEVLEVVLDLARHVVQSPVSDPSRAFAYGAAAAAASALVRRRR